MRVVRAAIVAGLASTFVLSAVRDGVAQTDRADVVKTYADIGQAMYEDALARARVLQKAVRALVDAPSEAALQTARQAWLSAREPYMQSEVFRFGNGVVDEWEGKVNAWPLDEGLIDYAEGPYGAESDSNPYYTANVIANKRLKVGSKTLDASNITKKVLRDLHEIGGVEANVATGYNPEGNAVVQAVIDGLVDQTKTFERIVAALKLKAIKFEGSDSLDRPDAILKEQKK